MTFALRSFSAVGVPGYQGDSPVDLVDEGDAPLWWPWLLMVFGVAAIIIVLVLRKSSTGKAGHEGPSSSFPGD